MSEQKDRIAYIAELMKQRLVGSADGSSPTPPTELTPDQISQGEELFGARESYLNIIGSIISDPHVEFTCSSSGNTIEPIAEKLQVFSYESKQTSYSNSVEQQMCVELDKIGPFIVCVDTSGSMKGSRERVAKSVCYGLIIKAQEQNRNCYLLSYSVSIKALDISLVKQNCVKVFKQRWYMVGRTEAGIRIYSLDRIESLLISDKLYTLPEDFDSKDFFNDSFGIIASDDYAAEEVQIKVYGTKAKYLKTLPLHHTQTEIEQGENFSILSYHIKPTYDFRAELLSHGAEVEVLSPVWFRDEVSDIISKQYDGYVGQEKQPSKIV